MVLEILRNQEISGSNSEVSAICLDLLPGENSKVLLIYAIVFFFSSAQVNQINKKFLPQFVWCGEPV
jgi:hypothetical protein